MKSECIRAAKGRIIENRDRMTDKDRELVDILVDSAYSILSNYKLGIHKNTGEVLIRPHEARFLLGNKIRPTKSIIQLILHAMKCRGMAERNNQFIVLKNK